MSSDNVIPIRRTPRDERPACGTLANVSTDPDEPQPGRDDAVSERYTPDPELQAKFDKLDALMEGMSPEQMREVVDHLYWDADGDPQVRTQRLRVVPDPE